MRLSLAITASIFVLSSTAHAETDSGGVIFTEQGWNAALRDQFYYTPQGSHMMPADWFAVLEQPSGMGRFGDPEFLKKYGFIEPDGVSDLNTEGYPIGVATDAATNHVGLTCAACHTANVEVGGELVRIDGAPGHLDFDAFFRDLALAVRLTLLDEKRFERFAAALGQTTPDGAAQLKAELAAFDTKITAEAVLRRPTLASGYGRVDALTQIVNSLAVRDQEKPVNLYPVAAPTSYPALWLTPELEFVQWNPIGSSPIARNGGQVLGVFGNTNLSRDAGEQAFSSTMLLSELHEMEEWLTMLEPPKWDEGRMGAIDEELAEQGEALFSANCSGCHNMAPYERTDPADNHFGKTFVKIGRIPFWKVGTDDVYSRSLLVRQIVTNETTAALFEGATAVPAIAFFGGAVSASVQRAMDDAQLSLEQKVALNGFRFQTDESGNPVPYEVPRFDGLKAGPLAGVWATGPYLHNGSVPTVYELLSPQEGRRKVFWTGGRELDTVALGYNSDAAPGRFRFDTALPGNGNQGHYYPPAGFNHIERMAVIEYLKTQ